MRPFSRRPRGDVSFVKFSTHGHGTRCTAAPQLDRLGIVLRLLGRRFMKRRDFLLVATMLVPAARHASAQQSVPKKRLAVIGITKVEDMRIGRDPGATIFLEELQRLGYIEGENLIVDRWQFQPGR